MSEEKKIGHFKTFMTALCMGFILGVEFILMVFVVAQGG